VADADGSADGCIWGIAIFEKKILKNYKKKYVEKGHVCFWKFFEIFDIFDNFYIKFYISFYINFCLGTIKSKSNGIFIF